MKPDKMPCTITAKLKEEECNITILWSHLPGLGINRRLNSCFGMPAGTITGWLESVNIWAAAEARGVEFGRGRNTSTSSESINSSSLEPNLLENAGNPPGTAKLSSTSSVSC